MIMASTPSEEVAMLRFTPALCLLLAAAAALAAPAPQPKPRKQDAASDLKKMQGMWTVVRRTLNGKDITETADRSVEIVEDRIRFLVGGEVRTEWAVTMDAKQSPKVLDRKRVAIRGGAAAAKGGK